MSTRRHNLHKTINLGEKMNKIRPAITDDISPYLSEIVNFYGWDFYFARLNVEFMIKNREQPYGFLISQALYSMICINYAKPFTYQQLSFENTTDSFLYKLSSEMNFLSEKELSIHKNLILERDKSIAHSDRTRFDRTNGQNNSITSSPEEELPYGVHNHPKDKDVYPQKNKFERIDPNIISDFSQRLLHYPETRLNEISLMILKLQNKLYENGLHILEENKKKIILGF